jgi:hypothetical protein
MPMPDFEALARDIQNRASQRVGAATTEKQHFREIFGTSMLVCSSSKKYGRCLKGTPSSQWVATRSICFGPFIL